MMITLIMVTMLMLMIWMRRMIVMRTIAIF